MKRLLSTSFAFFAIAILVLTVPVGFTGKAAPQAPTINTWGDFAAKSVKPGSTVQGRVYMEIPAGYHTQSNKPSDKYLVATKVDLYTYKGVRTGVITYPPAKFIAFGEEKKKLSVYEGRATFRFNVTVPLDYKEGEVAIKALIRYQSCNDHECYPPKTNEAWLKIPVQ